MDFEVVGRREDGADPRKQELHNRREVEIMNELAGQGNKDS